MQNFLTLPCYSTYFTSHIPDSCYFAIFIFYFIITERFYLRTLSFYFKIYYKNKSFQNSPTSKNRTNFAISFFHPPLKTEHLSAQKKRPLPEASQLIFVFNLTLQSTCSTRDFRFSHPHKLARDYSLSNNAACARYLLPILPANDQSDTYNTPYAPRDKHLTA